MRELLNLKGKRQRIETIEEALRIVRQSYPGAMKQGSLGSWSFYVPPFRETHQMVAEAWMVQGKNPGWWLRVKER